MYSTNVSGHAFDAKALKESNIIGSRICEMRKRRHLSQSEMAKRLLDYNITISATGYGKWECGISTPNVYQLLAISQILGVVDPIGTFTNTKIESPEPELNEDGEGILATIRQALIDCGKYRPDTYKSPKGERIIPVKVYNQVAAAGVGNFIDDSAAEDVDFPESTIPAGTDFGVRISGDSMLPRYVSGQIAMVKRCQELYPGQVGIFIYDGSAFIKMYTEVDPADTEIDDYTDSSGCVHRRIVLQSLNPEYDDIEISLNAYFSIVGRVLN